MVRVVIQQSLVPPIISKLGAELSVSAEVTKVLVTMADTRWRHNLIHCLCGTISIYCENVVDTSSLYDG